MTTRTNWIERSDAALAQNLHVLRESAATEILAVIKANAYGHGATTCAPMLARAGANWLGVTCASEGVRVRQTLGDLPTQILLMSGLLPEDAPLLKPNRLTPVVWTPEQARWLEPGTSVHIEIDTGMSRQGACPGPELAEFLRAAAHLQLDGIFTHFCSSEIAGSALTQHQQAFFEQAVAQAWQAGVRPAWVHAGNSSTIDNPAQPWPWLAHLAASVHARSMVRTGLALYGYCLPIDGDAIPHVQPNLQPVLTWKARILSIRELAPGQGIGYNQTFTAVAPMRVALLPVGYADGLRRELSSTSACGSAPARPGGWVMLHGSRAPILGRISMNLTVVDVTHIPQASPLDEVILLGPGITAADHARFARTIPYEILCGIHPCT